MWHSQLQCDVFSTSPLLSSIFLLLRLWPLSDLSDRTYYYYGMQFKVRLCKHLHSNCGCCQNGGVRRDCKGGRGELTIMGCTLQGNYAEGGGVTEVCGWGYYGMPAPWSFCVYVYARGVCERKKRRRRAHTLPQNTEIYLNCMYNDIFNKKELLQITWQSEAGVSVFAKCVIQVVSIIERLIFLFVIWLKAGMSSDVGLKQHRIISSSWCCWAWGLLECEPGRWSRSASAHANRKESNDRGELATESMVEWGGAGANLLGLPKDKYIKFDLRTMQKIYKQRFLVAFCFERSLLLNILFRCLFCFHFFVGLLLTAFHQLHIHGLDRHRTGSELRSFVQVTKLT